MSRPRITATYTCSPCGLKDRPVEIPSRDPGEDVVAWMRTVTNAIAIDHTLCSPDCRARKIDELKVPLSNREDARIGDPLGA